MREILPRLYCWQLLFFVHCLKIFCAKDVSTTRNRWRKDSFGSRKCIPLVSSYTDGNTQPLPSNKLGTHFLQDILRRQYLNLVDAFSGKKSSFTKPAISPFFPNPVTYKTLCTCSYFQLSCFVVLVCVSRICSATVFIGCSISWVIKFDE